MFSAVTVHVPVLLDEVVQVFADKGRGRFLDCTLGGGGHTRALLGIDSGNSVVAADRDSAALARMIALVDADVGVSGIKERLTVVESRFAELTNKVVGPFDGILADLGLSTDQLRGGRGFSFSDEGPLDMRMSVDAAVTAHSLVNDTTSSELYSLLRAGGVGGEARVVVEAIQRHRPIQSTEQLADLVAKVVRGADGKHPATVVFQALRIAVNDEFGEIRALLEGAAALMAPQGILAIISFHSLEDTLVTRCMRQWAQGDTAPAGWRGGGEHVVARGTLVTKKAIVPTVDEVVRNPSARSARMRVFRFF